MQHERYGEEPITEYSYDDLEGVEKVTSLPDFALHRDVDQIVLTEAKKDVEAVKVAIVCPPTIYGLGRGPGNRKSRQIPSMIQTTIQGGFGPIVEAGKNECNNVHVQDLSDLLVLLALQSINSDHNDTADEIWGPRAYYFAENGTQKWSTIADVIVKEAHKQELVPSSETKRLDLGKARQIHGFEALSWGLNSIGQAKRGRKYLGWNPTRPSLEATIKSLRR